MGDSFRSYQQIQNYPDLLCKETRTLYNPLGNLDNIIWLTPTGIDWVLQIISQMDADKESALLRSNNDNTRLGADGLTTARIEHIHVPQAPIADITTDTT